MLWLPFARRAKLESLVRLDSDYLASYTCEKKRDDGNADSGAVWARCDGRRVGNADSRGGAGGADGRFAPHGSMRLTDAAWMRTRMPGLSGREGREPRESGLALRGGSMFPFMGNASAHYSLRGMTEIHIEMCFMHSSYRDRRRLDR